MTGYCNTCGAMISMNRDLCPECLANQAKERDRILAILDEEVLGRQPETINVARLYRRVRGEPQ